MTQVGGDGMEGREGSERRGRSDWANAVGLGWPITPASGVAREAAHDSSANSAG